MSANLMWEPANRKAHSLPDALKFVLRDKMGISGERTPMGRDQLNYLSGLRDAGVDGAQTLIEAIDKYEVVEVWLEY